MGFYGGDKAVRPDQIGEQDGVVAMVGADIDDVHAALDDPRHEDGQPAFPESIQKDMGAEAHVRGGHVQLVTAEDAAKRDPVADIDRMGQSARVVLQRPAIHFGDVVGA